MTGVILLDQGLFDTRLALIEAGQVVALDVELRPEPGVPAKARLGEIYLGRVLKRSSETGGAFVDLGLAQPGFLTPDTATEGAALMVQVAREAILDKAPKLTAAITLAVRQLALRPKKGGLSVPPGADAALAAALRARWADIEARAKNAKAPALLWGAENPVAGLLDRWAPARLDRILVSGGACFAKARQWAARMAPELAAGVQRFAGPGELFDQFDANAALAVALATRLELAAGGAIVIEETQALTAIDVDSAAGGGREKAEGALHVNLAAANEIARQARLRGLGGVLAIDFLKLKSKSAQAKLMTQFKRALARDPVPSRVWPPSALGLVELARPRTGPSLTRKLAGPGGGPQSLLHPAFLAGSIARRIESASARAPGRRLRINCNPAVAARLESKLAELEKITGAGIFIAADPARGDEFEISAE